MANGIERAKSVYSDLCNFLDSKKWKYTRYDDDLYVKFTLVCRNIDMRFFVVSYDNREVVKFICDLSVNVPDNKTYEVATAVCMVNFKIPHGFFNFDVSKGTITYEVCQAYMGSHIDNGTFEFLIELSSFYVTEYNDKFYALAKDVINLKEFYDAIHKK